MAGMFGRLPPYPMNGLNYPSPNFDYFSAEAHGQMFGKHFYTYYTFYNLIIFSSLLKSKLYGTAVRGS